MSTGGKTGFLMRQRTEPDANSSMEAKGKAKKSIQKKKTENNKARRQNEKEGEHGKRQKGKDQRRTNRKRKRRGSPGGIMLTTSVTRVGTHHYRDRHTQAFIALVWVIKMKLLS